MKIRRMARLPVRIGRITSVHNFYVIPTSDGSVAVVVVEDLKLPPRTAASGRDRLVTKGKNGKGSFPVDPGRGI